MAIEVRVFKEIRQYKEKLFFGLNARQLLFGGIAGGIAVGIGVVNYFFLKVSIDAISWVILLLTIPFLALGWVERMGLPFERWIFLLIEYHFKVQQRPFLTELIKGEKQDAKAK
ncbi:hypothetical protein BH739_04650 [Enterococcus casseliflavus]|nr:hypothetical protein BH739_04650 [Enterococcus casseliflavus]